MSSSVANWLLLLATAAANLCVGAYAFARAPKVPLNRAFGFLALATSCWAAALALGYHTRPSEHGLSSTTTIIRVAFAAGSLFAVAFLVFIDRFASTTTSDRNVIRRCFVPIGLAFCVISFTPWIVLSARAEEDALTVKYGPLHPVFAIYALLGLGAAIYLLAKKYRRSEGLEAVQVRYVVLGIVVS